MARRSTGAVLLGCCLFAARTAAAQDPAGSPTHDLTLEQALALARSDAPAVRIALARVDEARGRLVSAGLLLRDNPTFEVGGGPRVGPAGTGVDLEVRIAQGFELGGQRGARLEAARAGSDRAAAAAEDATRRALRAVAAAFLVTRHADVRLGIAHDTERLTAELHRVAERRYEAGAAGILDAHVAALALARARTDVRVAEVARAHSAGALRRLLGLDAAARLSVRGDLLDRRRHALAELLERAPERADLRALDAAARQADAQARLGEAQAWPDLGLGLAYAREEEADIVLGTVTLTLPFFDHGQGTTATARARAAATRVERRAAEATLHAEVRAAFNAYERLLAAVDDFEKHGLPQIEKSEALARHAYQEGALQFGELLTIRRELVDARVAHADLLLRAALAGIDLESAAGALR